MGTVQAKYIKRVGLLAVAFLCGFGSAQAASKPAVDCVPNPSNCLSNPGFEEGQNNWTDLFGFPTEFQTVVVHSGAMAAKKLATILDPDEDYWSQVYQIEEEINASDPVYASGYLKSTFHPMLAAKGGLLAEFMNDANQVLSSIQSDQIGGETDWRFVELGMASVPTGTTKVRLSAYIFVDNNSNPGLVMGDLYIDDLVLQKNNVPLQQQTQILNGDFANGINDWTDLFADPSFVATARAGFPSVPFAAAKKVTNVSTQEYFSQIHQELDFSYPATGSVTAQIKLDQVANSDAAAGILVQYLDANGAVLSSQSSAVPNDYVGWFPVTLSWASVPGTVKVRISGFIYAPQGDVESLGVIALYDNFVLTAGSVKPPKAGR